MAEWQNAPEVWRSAPAVGAAPVAPPPPPRKDLVKRIVDDVQQGVGGFTEATAGFPGDLANSIGNLGAAAGLSHTVRVKPGGGLEFTKTEPGADFAGVVPTSPEINARMGIPAPQDAEERLARTAGGFVPNALFKGSLIQRGLRAAAPTAGVWGAGELTDQNPWAKLAGGLLGVIPGEALGSVLTNTARNVARGVTGKEVATIPETIAGLRLNPGVNSAFGAGGIRSTTPAPKRLPRIDRQVVDQFADDGGVRKIADNGVDYRLAGVEPRLFELGGDAAQRYMQFLSRAPGETGGLVKQAMREDLLPQSARASAAFDEALGSTTRPEMLRQIEDHFSQLSPQYDEILKQTVVSPELYTQRFQPILDKIPQRYLDQIDDTAEEIAKLAGQSVDDLSTGQHLHLMRRGIGQTIKRLEGGEGLAPDVKRGLTIVRKELTDAMEKVFPGYKDLNARWRGVSQAEEALGGPGEATGFASKVFGKPGDTTYSTGELADEFNALPPVGQDAARASVRNYAQSIIDKHTPDVKFKDRFINVGRPFLAFGPRFRQIMPKDKADALMGELGLSDYRFEKFAKVRPDGGSDTAPLAFMAEDASSALSKARDPVGVAANMAWRYALQAARKETRNRHGKTMLSKDPDMQEAILAELNKRRDRRSAVARGGLFGSMQGAHEHR